MPEVMRKERRRGGWWLITLQDLLLCFLFYCPALECINRHEMKTPPNPHVKHIIASEGWPSEKRRKMRTRRIRSFRESSWADTNSNHLWIALLSIHPSPVFCHWIASGDNKINPSTQDMGHRTDISIGVVCILWNVAGWLARIFPTSDMNFPPVSQSVWPLWVKITTTGS